MRNQIVQWIFLPGGLTEDGQLAASLFVAPRLRGDVDNDESLTLADFPDFVDWPAMVNGDQLNITLEREDGATEAPMQVTGGGSSELWKALFPSETPVHPFKFDDYADRPLVTYPLRQILDDLSSLWAKLASQSIDDLPISTRNASPIGPPLDGEQLENQTLSELFDELQQANHYGILEGVSDVEHLSILIDETLRSAAAEAASLRAQQNTQIQDLIQPFGSFNTGDSLHTAYYQLSMFHARPKRKPAEFPKNREKARDELAKKTDFHQLLSTLGDHPELLRTLGLVFDLIIRPDFLPTLTDQDNPSYVRVHIGRPSNFPTRSDPDLSPWNLDVTPWTQCRKTEDTTIGGSFSTAEYASEDASQGLVHGFVRMNPDRLMLVGVDVDGLALKALNTAVTLERQDNQPQRPVEEEARSGTPTPRTGGIALVLTGRAEKMHDDFYLARKHNIYLENDPLNPAVLRARQLVRGYRVDIRDGNTGKWRSLHARHVDYMPLRNPNLKFSVADEGFVQVSLAGEVDRPNAPADPDGALYVHEALVTWDGWSLSAQRHESAIAQEPAPPAASADLGALQLDLKVKPLPASLPRLRFGGKYQIRLRTVDLAGKSHLLHRANDLTDLLDSSGLPEYRVSLPDGGFVYRRFEPVPPPALVARSIFSPGEGLERLVVRSNVGISAEDYAAASQAATEETLRFRPFCDRHVAPPKTSLQLAEAHGMFDEAIDVVRGLPIEEVAGAVDSFYKIAKREKGSFRDIPGARPIAIATCNQQDPLCQSEPQGPDEPQHYVVIDADEIELPYLPDPFCSGVVIRLQFPPITPGQPPIAPEQRFGIKFSQAGNWHELLPIRLRLEEGDPLAAYDEEKRLFTVSLPQGRTARMLLNSLFYGNPNLFGIMAWCRDKRSPSEADEIFEAITESRFWMTTPWSTLHLVHAVQQPLQDPFLDLTGIEGGTFERTTGSTAAELKGTITIDGASTASLDLTAEWDDVVDDIARPLNEYIDPTSGQIDMQKMKQHIRANAFKIILPEPWGTPWADNIKEYLNALDDGWQEWMVEFSTVNGENIEAQISRVELLKKSADPALSEQERTRLAAAAAHLEGLRSHEFGDTRYRKVKYQMVAATRFREYFDPKMPVEAGNSTGNVVMVDMLSSASPPPPEVLDVVPIVRWERNGAAGSEQASTRHCAGLRVWLARPWFTSGDGEKLGLVYEEGSTITRFDELYHEVSIISQDPMHATRLPVPFQESSFPGADHVHNISLGTIENYDLALFEPRPDGTRDAWYCDIEFETSESYFPFVRLGLVRYQPNSLPECKVSSIVPTTFLQPLPDRSLTVIRLPANRVAVKLHGPAPRARMGVNGSESKTNDVEAVVEVQDPITSDPALGWIAVGEKVTLTPTLVGESQVEWSAEVPLPTNATSPLRLAVREYEIHPTDNRSGDTPELVAGKRLVHVDTVPLS